MPDSLCGNTRYFDIIQKANEMAAKLIKEEDSYMIISLSHLDYQYNENKVSDETLDRGTDNIDLITGGHTQFFLMRRYHTKTKQETMYR